MADADAPPSPNHVKSLLIEMGFNSTLVQKAIDEKGVHDLESLVDILTKNSEPDIQCEADGARMVLLTMKFPQNLVDLALSRLGKETPLDKLIDFITAAQLDEENAEESDEESTEESDDDLLDGIETSSEDENVILANEKVSAAPATCPSKGGDDDGSSGGTANVGVSSEGKRTNDKVDKETDSHEREKRLRPEYMGSSSEVVETPRMKDGLIENSHESLSAKQPRWSQTLPVDLAKRPYFFYGNLTELSPEWCSRTSRFFLGTHTEHVDTRLWSALSRKEGYVHNLPIENRFNILPNPSMDDPNTTSPPVEPDILEGIMGYPPNHTKIGVETRLAERMKLLDHCFQTDTLRYHLSVLQPMFPQGLTVLSLFSGMGGAEIALSRLGIHLKGVVSVEHCGVSREILKRWWETSGQTGELVQIEDIRTVRIKKLDSLMQRFGGLDLIICQNPPTPADLSEESSGSEAFKFDDITLFNEVVRVTRRVKELMQ